MSPHQPPGAAGSDGAGERGHPAVPGEPPGGTRARQGAVRRRVARASPALKFVLMVGVMSFFADFTYEGSRSIIGPYLGLLGAGGAGDRRHHWVRRVPGIRAAIVLRAPRRPD